MLAEVLFLGGGELRVLVAEDDEVTAQTVAVDATFNGTDRWRQRGCQVIDDHTGTAIPVYRGHPGPRPIPSAQMDGRIPP